MCGINGVVKTQKDELLEDTVAAMNAAMVHRGPDDGGIADIGFGVVGMRRLSIIDLKSGSQPMWTPDRRYCIVFNGEIYDYQALRRRLQDKGFQFQTNSDTEVLLHHFVDQGVEGLASINGMFGFAVVDCKVRSITLVRDRVGIKPLYYFLSNDGTLSFSSELGSLLQNPSIPRELDRDSLANFLVDRFVSDPQTMFRGVQQLEAGHWLRWQGGVATTGRFVRDFGVPEDSSEQDAIRRLGDLLKESISSQMVADVPLGVFLSGGIDSSAVAAIAASVSSAKIRTFSVGFDDAAYDESSIAQEVADRIGSDHTEIRVRNRGFNVAILDKVVRHVGQPVGDSSCIPMMHLCQETARHVKVALSGDGGDEGFGGYEHINWYVRLEKFRRLSPTFVRSGIAQFLAMKIPVMERVLGANRLRRLRKGLEVSLLEPDQRLRQLMALWRPTDISSLDGIRGTPGRGAYEKAYDVHCGQTDEELAMRVLAESFMRGAILTKVDRMSMAASLEVRVPLLDNRILDFSHTLPHDMKIRDGVGKYVLRRAVSDLLPDSVFEHRKQGFAIPLSAWLNDEFYDYLHTMCGTGSALRSIFGGELDTIIADSRSSKKGTSRVSDPAAASRVWVAALIGHWIREFRISL